MEVCRQNEMLRDASAQSTPLTVQIVSLSGIHAYLDVRVFQTTIGENIMDTLVGQEAMKRRPGALDLAEGMRPMVHALVTNRAVVIDHARCLARKELYEPLACCLARAAWFAMRVCATERSLLGGGVGS